MIFLCEYYKVLKKREKKKKNSNLALSLWLLPLDLWEPSFWAEMGVSFFRLSPKEGLGSDRQAALPIRGVTEGPKF